MGISLQESSLTCAGASRVCLRIGQRIDTVINEMAMFKIVVTSSICMIVFILSVVYCGGNQRYLPTDEQHPTDLLISIDATKRTQGA